MMFDDRPPHHTDSRVLPPAAKCLYRYVWACVTVHWHPRLCVRGERFYRGSVRSVQVVARGEAGVKELSTSRCMLISRCEL